MSEEECSLKTFTTEVFPYSLFFLPLLFVSLSRMIPVLSLTKFFMGSSRDSEFTVHERMRRWSLDSSSPFVSWVECVVFVRDSLCLYSLLSVCESKQRESNLDSHQDVLRVSFVSSSLFSFFCFVSSLPLCSFCSDVAFLFVCFLEYISLCKLL